MIHTPVVPHGADRRLITVDVTLGSSGGAHFEVKEELHGASAVTWRRSLETIPKALLKQQFEEEYVAALVSGASLQTVSIEGTEAIDQPLVLQYAFDVDSLGQRMANSWLIPGLFPADLSAIYATASTRTIAELVPAPTDVHVELRIHAPSGYRVQNGVADVSFRGPLGSIFKTTSTLESGTLRIVRHVWIPPGRIAPSVYPTFASFCRSVDETEARKVRLARSP
jgi:hypothetical protein